MDLPVSSHQIALLRSMTWACHVVDLGRVHEVVATTTEHVRSHWSFKMETWNLKRGGFDATLRQAAACTPRDMPIIPTYPWIEGWKLVPISWKNELKKVIVLHASWDLVGNDSPHSASFQRRDVRLWTTCCKHSSYLSYHIQSISMFIDG